MRALVRNLNSWQALRAKEELSILVVFVVKIILR